MKRATPALAFGLSLVALGLPVTDQAAFAQPDATYQIRVTNLTPRQSFTPFLAATHNPTANVFLPGTFASPELKALAEGGDVAPLTALLSGMPAVKQVVSGSGLTTPGVTTVLTVMGGGPYNRLSVVSMLIPTNDTFVGINTSLPMGYEPKVVYAYAYDAGTEVNDESCASIPGPNYAECGGPGSGGAPGNGEGAIVISSGIKGVGDFGVDRDWKNPVARFTIQKMTP